MKSNTFQILSEFKNVAIFHRELDKIRLLSSKINKVVKFMEVCGTHTMQISYFGIRKVLPQNVELISGPGCPVCVTPIEYVDKAIYLLKKYNNIVIATFGDMFRVPGSESSLEVEKSKGKIVEVVYSPVEVIDIAKRYRNNEVVFLSIGFETTMPGISVLLQELKRLKIENVSLLVGNKFFLPAMRSLLNSLDKFFVNGFILPGHLSSIIGSNVYKDIVKNYKIGGVVCGFEPVDIVIGIRTLLEMIGNGNVSIVNEYSRVVKPEGNIKAKKIISRTFVPTESLWRGLGWVADSGAKLTNEYSFFDAEKRFSIPKNIPTKKQIGCKCAEVILGKIKPYQCSLFGKVCSPEKPVGACMVSSEGSCAAYYKYER